MHKDKGNYIDFAWEQMELKLDNEMPVSTNKDDMVAAYLILNVMALFLIAWLFQIDSKPQYKSINAIPTSFILPVANQSIVKNHILLFDDSVFKTFARPTKVEQSAHKEYFTFSDNAVITNQDFTYHQPVSTKIDMAAVDRLNISMTPVSAVEEIASINPISFPLGEEKEFKKFKQSFAKLSSNITTSFSLLTGFNSKSGLFSVGGDIRVVYDFNKYYRMGMVGGLSQQTIFRPERYSFNDTRSFASLYAQPKESDGEEIGVEDFKIIASRNVFFGLMQEYNFRNNWSIQGGAYINYTTKAWTSGIDHNPNLDHTVIPQFSFGLSKSINNHLDIGVQFTKSTKPNYRSTHQEFYNDVLSLRTSFKF